MTIKIHDICMQISQFMQITYDTAAAVSQTYYNHLIQCTVYTASSTNNSLHSQGRN